MKATTEQVEAAIKAGRGLVPQILSVLEKNGTAISRGQFYRLTKKHPELAEAMEEARQALSEEDYTIALAGRRKLMREGYWPAIKQTIEEYSLRELKQAADNGSKIIIIDDLG